MTDTCHFCRQGIGPQHKNEIYRINSFIFCSLNCFFDDEKKPKAPVKKSKKKSKRKKK